MVNDQVLAAFSAMTNKAKNPLPVLWQWDLKILVKESEPECHAAQHILSVMNPRNGTDSSCIFGAKFAGRVSSCFYRIA
jgi:hypothetical protein